MNTHGTKHYHFVSFLTDSEVLFLFRTENLYGSSSFVESLITTKSEDHLQDKTVLEVTDHLEIDRYETPLVSCSLLNNPAEYNADTVDLGGDKEALEYWLKCFEESLPKFTERALDSQAHSKSALERSDLFKNQVRIFSKVKYWFIGNHFFIKK
jgi:hypothetical protein